MESQSAMPAADAASSVIDVLSARLEDAPACGDDAGDAGLLVFLGRVPDRRRVPRGRRTSPRRSWRWRAGRSRRGPDFSLTATRYGLPRHRPLCWPPSGCGGTGGTAVWVVPVGDHDPPDSGLGIDADALDAQVGAWLLALAGYGCGRGCRREPDGGRGGRQDRPRRPKQGGAAPHLLAAITCDEVAVIARQQVVRRATRSPRSLRCSGTWTWPGRSSSPTPCVPSGSPPGSSWRTSKPTTCSPSRRTSRPCSMRQRPALGRRPVAHTGRDRGHGRDETRTIQVARPRRPAVPARRAGVPDRASRP